MFRAVFFSYLKDNMMLKWLNFRDECFEKEFLEPWPMISSLDMNAMMHWYIQWISKDIANKIKSKWINSWNILRSAHEENQK